MRLPVRLRHGSLVRACALLLAVTAGLAGAGRPSGAMAAPAPALLAPIDRLVAAINANSINGIAAAYVVAPTIVDEFPPFHWSHNGAARHWARDFTSVARDAKITHVRVTRHRPSYQSVDGMRAWLVVPTDYRYDVAGKPQTESAAWTFVLVETDGVWNIEASTWAKTAGAP